MPRKCLQPTENSRKLLEWFPVPAFLAGSGKRVMSELAARKSQGSIYLASPNRLWHTSCIKSSVPPRTKPKPEPPALEQIRTIRRLLHELNNVLTGELISAGLLRSLVPLTPPGGRYASDIEASLERARELVGGLHRAVQRLESRLRVRPIHSTSVCDVRPSLGQPTGED